MLDAKIPLATKISIYQQIVNSLEVCASTAPTPTPKHTQMEVTAPCPFPLKMFLMHQSHITGPLLGESTSDQWILLTHKGPVMWKLFPWHGAITCMKWTMELQELPLIWSPIIRIAGSLTPIWWSGLVSQTMWCSKADVIHRSEIIRAEVVSWYQ